MKILEKLRDFEGRSKFRTWAPIDGVLDRVREHLEACPCCSEQFKLVLETLKAIEEK